MRCFLAALFGLAICAGCTTEAEKKMGGGEVAPPYLALEKFSAQPMMSVGYPLGRKDIAAAKQAAASAEFAAAIAEFEQEPLPDGYSEKQAAKDAAVTAMKAVAEAGKSGSNEDFVAKFEALKLALAAVRL